jgi:hypothetical protein
VRPSRGFRDSTSFPSPAAARPSASRRGASAASEATPPHARRYPGDRAALVSDLGARPIRPAIKQAGSKPTRHDPSGVVVRWSVSQRACESACSNLCCPDARPSVAAGCARVWDCAGVSKSQSAVATNDLRRSRDAVALLVSGGCGRVGGWLGARLVVHRNEVVCSPRPGACGASSAGTMAAERASRRRPPRRRPPRGVR